MTTIPMLGVPAGTLLEPVGAQWVAFSPISGQTLVLNSEAAALLEVFMQGPQALSEAISAFAADVGVSPASVEPLLRSAEALLRAAGLVRVESPGPAPDPAAAGD